MPNGKDRTIPVTPMMIESIKPPNFADSTASSPSGIIEETVLDAKPVKMNHQIRGAKIAAIAPAKDPSALLKIANAKYPKKNPTMIMTGNHKVPPHNSQNATNG